MKLFVIVIHEPLTALYSHTTQITTSTFLWETLQHVWTQTQTEAVFSPQPAVFKPEITVNQSGDTSHIWLCFRWTSAVVLHSKKANNQLMIQQLVNLNSHVLFYVGRQSPVPTVFVSVRLLICCWCLSGSHPTGTAKSHMTPHFF